MENFFFLYSGGLKQALLPMEYFQTLKTLHKTSNEF